MSTETKQITLATLPEATAQQVFDQVARHLLTQGVKARSGNSCAYRGHGGTMCAAGCLLSDEEYALLREERMRAMTIGPEGSRWGVIARHTGVVSHESLISDLQYLHDGEPVHWWKAGLARVAEQHGLSMAVLREFPERLTGLRAAAAILDDIGVPA